MTLVISLVPISICGDNDFTIKLAMNPVFHDKTKHFQNGVHFIREKFQKELLNWLRLPL